MEIKKSPKFFLRGELVNTGNIHLIEDIPGMRYQLKKHLSNRRDKRGVAIWAQYSRKYMDKEGTF